VGFATVALNAFHEGMGVVDMIAVDPAVSAARDRDAADEPLGRQHARGGMDIAVVETGGDPGHASARAMYEGSGYTALHPVVRYLKLLRR
jgi:hypothetical protein